MQILRIENIGVEAAAQKAALALKAGGIVLYPTDTLYGLAVDAASPEALDRLKALKGRDTGKPISIIVPSIEEMEQYGRLNTAARSLAERFLPGPLTLVLPATELVAPELAADGTIGIRIPNDEFCLALAEAFGRPYTATSANKAGLNTPGTAAGVIEQLGEAASEVALIIEDGERARVGASTVVDATGETPAILREGALSREALGL